MAADPLAELNTEEKRILAELAQAKAEGRMSKRDLLKMGGALGVGAAMGGGGYLAATESARAATNQAGTVGTSGSPVDVEGEDLNVTSINTDEVYTVPAGTPADIDAACSNYDVVILQQGATYSGSTTITVPNETKVYAYSATIDYTGTGEAIVIAGSAGQNPRPRPMWFGGTISGNVDADAGIVVRDTYGSVTRDVEIEGFDGTGTGRGDGWVVENVDGWSEENELHSPSLADNHRAIAFRPANVTGGTGTGSFKGTVIKGGHIETAGTGGYGIYFNGTVYDSTIKDIATNVNQDDTMVSMGGGMGQTVVQNINGEAQGSANVTAMEFRTFGGAIPSVKNVACGGAATDIADPGGTYDNSAAQIQQKAIQIGDKSQSALIISNGGSGLPYGTDLAYYEGGTEFAYTDTNGDTHTVLNAMDGGAIRSLSGVTGDKVGDTGLDDGTNTTHGDPDLCIWNGSAWRQAGTTNTFS